MGAHPMNLALRFLLEILALLAIGMWSYRLVPNGWKYILAALIPILVATAWGVFNVPGDPSRSGAAPVIVPGLIRLIVELAIFTFASWALFTTGHTQWSVIFSVIILIHYLISYDRVGWLLQH